MAEPNLHPPDFTEFLQQEQSPIFYVLPPEIRNQIFAFALSSYEDTGKLYSANTYWRRPGYDAPHRTCIELLQTCKRVYLEAWFMPFAYAEHSFYLTALDRAPARQITPQHFERCLKTIHRVHGKLEAGIIRVFAQLWALEPGDRFQKILKLRYFHPKSITLTIRYTDFWFWETNEPLRIKAAWVKKIYFPSSVTQFNVDFESIERRKAEIDYIAKEASEKWYFRRIDGRILSAREFQMSVSKWSGSSTLGGNRWVRDEVRPGQLDYHIVTVKWRLSSGPHSEHLLELPPDLAVASHVPRPPPLRPRMKCIPESALAAANVSPDATAEEAWETLH